MRTECSESQVELQAAGVRKVQAVFNGATSVSPRSQVALLSLPISCAFSESFYHMLCLAFKVKKGQCLWTHTRGRMNSFLA